MRIRKPKPTPDLVNGHSDWNTEDFLHSIDPSLWMEEDDKKVSLEENLYDTYLRLLKAGELLPGTTFETFEKLQHDFDIDIISKIKKRIEDKNKKEGIANLFMRLRGLA